MIRHAVTCASSVDFTSHNKARARSPHRKQSVAPGQDTGHRHAHKISFGNVSAPCGSIRRRFSPGKMMGGSGQDHVNPRWTRPGRTRCCHGAVCPQLALHFATTAFCCLIALAWVLWWQPVLFPASVAFTGAGAAGVCSSPPARHALRQQLFRKHGASDGFCRLQH